ncbi:MAG: ABC transporter substrate-binding protein [Gammaproteobacteria bacterium]|nr:ABC transporter substrate-binding protein [Gammaproteobacteria bacterium]
MLPRALLVASVAALGIPALACAPARDATRIAVAGGSLTEIVYLLGAQDRIVAVDTTSNYPEAATALPSVGYVRNLSVEGLLSLSPSLILGEDDMGPPAVLDQLAQAGVETVRVAEQHDPEGIFGKIACIGEVLGMGDEADARVEDLRAVADRLAAYREVSERSPRVAMLLNLRDGAPVAAGDNTSGGGFLRMAGARNVFPSIDGWKPVSPEAFAAANPDVIVIPERGVRALGGVADVASHPSLRLTSAARNGRIVVMDGMAMLGFGPRTLEAALDFATRLHGPVVGESE